MSTASKALREAAAFGQMFKNIIALEEELREAGSLENMIAASKAKAADAERLASEAKVRLDGIHGEIASKIDEAEAEAAQIKTKAEAVLSSANSVLADAEKTAAESRSRCAASEVEAAAIIRRAQDEALAIVDKAQQEARRAVDEAAGSVSDMRQQAAEAGARRECAERAVGVAEQKLRDVESEIARLKRAFSA